MTEAIVNMMDLDPASRWSMADVAFNLHRVHEEKNATGTHEHVGPPVDPAGPSVHERTATLIEPAPTPAAPSPGPDPTPPPPGRRRWPLAILGLAALVIAAVVLWTILDDGPDKTSDGAGDRPTEQASPSDDSTQQQPDESGESPAENGDPASPADDGGTASVATDPAEFVTDYYGLLPDDTEQAWQLLSSKMQSATGTYDDYVGFWSTIDSVSVDEASEVGAGTVEVTLTYTTDGASEQEVRQIDLAEQGESFVIVDD